LSDLHMGGEAGSEIFRSAAELTDLVQDLNQHPGPVELVLAGDLLDLLRMGGAGHGEERVTATITRPDYQDLFAALRSFKQSPGHRVVYLAGNHDAEVWSNSRIQRTLIEAGLVDDFGLSYSASFDSLPDQLIYCEHGNQFDPNNTLVDYANPLDTPVGAHIVTELVRPIGPGAAILGSLDLGEVSYLFPLAAIPEWIGGRIFYQFLGMLLRWLLGPAIVAYAAYTGVTALVGGHGGSTELRPVILQLVCVLGLLTLAAVVVFLVSRRMAEHAASTLFTLFPGRAPGPRRSREEVAIRQLLEHDRPPPMAGTVSPMDIAVFVSAHTHDPALSTLRRSDGRETVIVNTGCWLRQLKPVDAWLGARPVFVPSFVQTHVRVQSSRAGVVAELWEHPKPAERALPWIERLAIAGRMPSQPHDAEPRLVARRVVERGPGRQAPPDP
ncbi:MAG: metallophosphoesterase, partial [Candidatus Dormibacteraeota bacterium]|nr:metallophosphoesterase [Candidatus Dormibacteraeota bacterium]